MASLTAEIRHCVRPVILGLREVPHWAALAGQGGHIVANRPRVVFLPARGIADGASRLRIYAIARALQARGWRCLTLNWRLTLTQRTRLIRAFKPDVMMMQGARHALNRPALYPGIPVVYDMDDADFHLPHLEAPVQAAMGQVSAVIAGSTYIADWCRAQGAEAAHVVWTGTPPTQHAIKPQMARPNVVAWAQTRPMSYVLEAELVRTVMRQVASQLGGVTLRLFDRLPGDDPGFAQSFERLGLRVEWRPRASYARYLSAIDDVAIGLAPLCPETPFSRGKSFGKVLAYLDRGAVVVGSDAAEHGGFFTKATGVISNDPDVWAQDIVRLLQASEQRHSMATAGRAAFLQRLSSQEAARRVERVLQSVISRDGAAQAA